MHGGRSWVSLRYTHKQLDTAQSVIFRHDQAIEIGTVSYKRAIPFPSVRGYAAIVSDIKFDLEPSNFSFFKEGV